MREVGRGLKGMGEGEGERLEEGERGVEMG